jgi:hypothetical protein
MLHHPIVQGLEITACVRPTELGIRLTIVSDPVERNKSNISRTHDPLAQIVYAMVCE